MATVVKNDKVERCFYVVHPLDDVPEEKFDAEHLGPMPMTRSVKWSLFALRAYLILMGVLVGYHVLDLAGLFGHHIH
ncbi:MAG: hypothetical protein ABFD64_04885 [Armatimonadota bacterium]